MLRSKFKKESKCLMAILSSSVFLLLFILPLFSHAQQGYVPLAPIAGYTDPNSASDLSGYLKNMFMLGVAIATGLAVIMIVIGGIQYMSTDAISGKTEGREKIAAALWGLLIALASYAILQTINPSLLSTTLTITPASGTTNGSAGQNGGGLSAAGSAAVRSTIGSSGLSFTDPSLYTGYQGSPISSYYQDSNGNMVFNYQNGTQIIQYWDNNGPTGQGQYYDSSGSQIVNGKAVSYVTYSSNGTPTYYFNDGTSYTPGN